MSTNDSLSNRSNNDYDSSKFNSNIESKLQDVGCCGDVPKVVKNKKRDKLLEWLKSSQLKREENNRQVFSRWIDMVDNGAIDLTMNKPLKPNTVNIEGSTEPSLVCSGLMSPSSQTIKSPIIPQPNSSINIPSGTINYRPSNSCNYYAPIVNNTPINGPYYGINSVPSNNWFNSQQNSAMYYPYSIMTQPTNNLSTIYPNIPPYNNPILSTPAQYIPVQSQNSQCGYCPQQFIIPTQQVTSNDTLYSQKSNISIEQNKPFNIEMNKWIDILNEIKINSFDKSPNEKDDTKDDVSS